VSTALDNIQPAKKGINCSNGELTNHADKQFVIKFITKLDFMSLILSILSPAKNFQTTENIEKNANQ